MTTVASGGHSGVDAIGRSILCHEWLTTYGGSDQVAARLAGVLKISTIATYAAWPETVDRLFPRSEVRVIGPKGASASAHWRWFLPQMPSAWRTLDLSSYDLVVTSSHATVNAVRPRRDALLISYCHTPMRYAWEWKSELGRVPLAARPFWGVAAAALRRADRRRAQRVDLFLANSRFVAERIGRFYGKPSLIVNPPVTTSFWTPGEEPREDYFLISGRMVAYKRPDLVVQAAVASNQRLIVAGTGPMLPTMKRAAHGRIEFVEAPSNDELRTLYRQARAYLFAGVEDFGMSIVEAQSCGTPVIAYANGGALETVIPGVNGELVDDAHASAFSTAMKEFDPSSYDPAAVRDSALRFDVGMFDRMITWAVDRAVSREWSMIEDHPSWVGSPDGARQIG